MAGLVLENSTFFMGKKEQRIKILLLFARTNP